MKTIISETTPNASKESKDGNISSILPQFTTSSLLLSEKYKASHYSDLLTEEKINKEILTWLKSWDDLVFDRKFEIPKTPVIQNKSIGKSSYSPFKKGRDNNQVEYKEVEYVRSKHKIILIAGPPGIGKTTLAKVISLQCGYEPIIVNASDERTPEKLITRMYDATLIHSLNVKVGQKAKPTCLILDEIDGMVSNLHGKTSIKTIIDFIKYGKVNSKILNDLKKTIIQENKEANDEFGNNNKNVNINYDFTKKKTNKNQEERSMNFNENSSDSEEEIEEKSYSKNGKLKQTNSKFKTSQIKRPIICICNNLYTKSISLLRKEALIFNIKKADDKKLFGFLKKVAKNEGIAINNDIINHIIELSEYDIRSCLNCLQFFKLHKDNKELIGEIMEDKDKLKILCSKDFNENLFALWQRIIYGPTVNPNNLNFNIISGLNESKPLKYKEMKRLYYACGEFSKIIEGLFVNYLKINCGKEEPSFEDVEKRSELCEIFSFEDYIGQRGFRSINQDVHNYQCFSGLYINNYYQNKNYKYGKGIVEYPNLFYEYKQSSNKNKSVIESIREHIYEKKHIHFNEEELITDIIPQFYYLMQPNIKEMNYDIMDKSDRLKVETAIGVMNFLGVSLKEINNSSSNGMNIEDDINVVFSPDISFFLPEQRSSLSLNQKIILKQALERIRGELDFASSETEKINQNKEKYESLFGVLLGRKKKKDSQGNNEDRFIYRYHEGVTDCVIRPLNIKYFFV